MQIKELLFRDITRAIDPVIYFHKNEPETLQREVEEYVITSRNDREETGIHEQYVKLLRAMKEALEGGVNLPAVWISGFFGSGKSSFAKLLGYSFADVQLPRGVTLARALLDQDDTPRSGDFEESYTACRRVFGECIPVVFDISAVAKSGDLPFTVIFREVQKALGYSHSEPVATYEHILEKEERYSEFLKRYHEVYGEDFQSQKDKTHIADEFSLIYHYLKPQEFPHPMDWYDSHYVNRTLREPAEIRRGVEDLISMQTIRGQKKRLLIVIDEMSQFIGKNTDRMLNLQTFVSEIGSKKNSPIWILVTGQEKLEDFMPEQEITRLQDRFPPKFRVHLHKTNVNEIVRRRILKKSETGRQKIAEILTEDVLSRIKNNGYRSESITESEVIDFYPLLPSYVPLLLDLSQAIKSYSTRAQADSASVRSVLQTIFDLFNSQKTNFKDRELGDLVTMNDVYSIISSALSSEVAQTIDRIRNQLGEANPNALELARIIALLEMNSEREMVSEEFLYKMTFSSLFENPSRENLRRDIALLERENFIYLEEGRGYRIKDTVAQEWARDRDRIPVGREEVQTLIDKISYEIFDEIPRPKLENIALELELLTRGSTERRKNLPKVKLDLRYTAESLFTTTRDHHSVESNREVRNGFSREYHILIAPGSVEVAEGIARSILQSEKMISRNTGNLSPAKQKIRTDESNRLESQRDRFKTELRRTWGEGFLYFKGREKEIHFGSSRDAFQNGIKSEMESYLPELFPFFGEALVNVTIKSLDVFFAREISSPGTELMDGGLGLLKRNQGRFEVVTDEGISGKVYDFIKQKVSIRGDSLIETFGNQPYGFSSNTLLAVTTALLRAEVIKIQLPNHKLATSYRDEGVKDALTNALAFRQIQILSNKNEDIDVRDKRRCADYFATHLEVKGVAIDNTSIYEAIYTSFPGVVEGVVELLSDMHLSKLEEPGVLLELRKNLDICRSDRSVLGSVKKMVNLLPELTEGILYYNDCKTSFTPTAREKYAELALLLEFQAKQLEESGLEEPVRIVIQELQTKIRSTYPWKELSDHRGAMDAVKLYYREERIKICDKNRARAEEAIQRLKARNGYDRLSEENQTILRGMVFSSIERQDPESLVPGLTQLKSLFLQIQEDENKANDKLDEFLSKKDIPKPIEVRKLRHNLQNREIPTEAELELVLQELRENCLDELKKGYTVRLV